MTRSVSIGCRWKRWRAREKPGRGAGCNCAQATNSTRTISLRAPTQISRTPSDAICTSPAKSLIPSDKKRDNCKVGRDRTIQRERITGYSPRLFKPWTNTSLTRENLLVIKSSHLRGEQSGTPLCSRRNLWFKIYLVRGRKNPLRRCSRNDAVYRHNRLSPAAGRISSTSTAFQLFIVLEETPQH